MSKIRVLPEILANKIAAGEIVERPSSVVKELLENSLDAGARSIEVMLESGGKRLVAVRDDGEGMTQDDAILAFEHHATSKIQSADDLIAIQTLGFRGEALPAIASIARLTMRTRSHAGGEATGTEIEIQGGAMRSVKPIAWDRGTEVGVRDLFFNVPARRKFLRSHDTELGHITRLVTHYALAHPGIRVVLTHDGRKLLEVTPVLTLRERVHQVFGEEFLKNLVEISGRSGEVEVRGFTSMPHEQRTSPYSQFFYVNRRMVRDKVITSAVRQAYRNTMPSSAYPVVILFVDLPFSEVDVNAHPAKTEIRFRQSGVVHDLIRNTIERFLIGARSIPVYEHRADAWGPTSAPESPYPKLFDAAMHRFDFTPPSAAADPFARAFNFPFRETLPTPPTSIESHHALALRGDLLFGAEAASTEDFFQAGGVRILGQLHESYIVGADARGLLIIDQHVAHERILYERNAEAMQHKKVEIQKLLVPITLELQPHQMVILDKVSRDLSDNGLQVERFGGNTILVRTVPVIAKDYDCRALLAELLEGLEAEERILDVKRIQDRIAVSMACRGAIKVHMSLTIEKMQWLLDELVKTRIPTNCPHGRPVILRFSLYEIERNFGRI